MSRTGFAISMFAICMLMWLMVALYLNQPALPEPVIPVDEPDAGAAIFPTGAEPDAMPQMLLVPCPLTPRSLPIVDPERTA
jgi:hypothetical protein